MDAALIGVPGILIAEFTIKAVFGFELGLPLVCIDLRCKSMADIGTKSLLQVIPLLLVIIIIVVALLRHQAARQRQVQGVLWLQAMRLLITHVQRHRGLSSGVLSGEGDLLTPLAEVQAQVSRDFEHISSIGDWVKDHDDWQAITQHWARLAGNLGRLSMRQNLDQHSRLIKNVLVFVDEIAQAHYLNPLSGNRADIWRDLLTLAEYVGQVRALGTSVAACSAMGDEEGREFSTQELLVLQQVIFSTLESPRYRAGVNADDLQSILDFLAYLDSELLKDNLVVSASEFYAVATRTLDQIYERFDDELMQANRRLSGQAGAG